MTAIFSEATKMRDLIVSVGRSLFSRGLTPGSTGNISVKLSSGELLMTPTSACLGALDPVRISRFSAEGIHIEGDKPTKEALLHQCMYCQRPSAEAVIHLHSPHAVALSLLSDTNFDDALPPLTAYYVMRVGRLPMIGYFPPGDLRLADAVKLKAASGHALLLANHGQIVAGTNLYDAQYAAEEIEETAKLHLLTRHDRVRPLTGMQRAALLKTVRSE